MQLVLASANPGKLREIEALLAPRGIQVASAASLGFLEEVAETGQTFEANATLKARAVCQALGRPALADDSGLEVQALDGRPGVYSARYAGDGADDAANNAKLLGELRGLAPERRGAAFVCVMACARPDGGLLLAQGRLEGRIVLEPAGSNGFGYDPVFQPSGQERTVAQLAPEEKNRISHRSQALTRLVAGLPAFLQGR